MLGLMQQLHANWPAHVVLAVYSEPLNRWFALDTVTNQPDRLTAAEGLIHELQQDDDAQVLQTHLQYAQLFWMVYRLPLNSFLVFAHTNDLQPITVDYAVRQYILSHDFQTPNGDIIPALHKVISNAEDKPVAVKVVDKTSHKEKENPYARLMESLVSAQRSQNRLSSDYSFMKLYIKDFCVYFKPKDLVGGDFYYFQQTIRGFHFAVGDYTGHGVEGALGATMCSSLLSQIVTTQPQLSPAKVLDRLHSSIKNLVHNSSDKGNTMPGLEILYGNYFADTQTMTFASVGISWLIQTKDELDAKRGQKMVLGSSDIKAEDIEELAIEIKAQSTLYMFSDGLKDQLGGDRQRRLGRSLLHDFLRLHAGKDLTTLETELEVMLATWRQDTEQTDDITFIGMRF